MSNLTDKSSRLGRASPRLLLRLLCNDCRATVDLDRDKLVTDLLSVSLTATLLLEGCNPNCNRVITFRCNDCTIPPDEIPIVPEIIN
jgi:hypothetical protein